MKKNKNLTINNTKMEKELLRSFQYQEDSNKQRKVRESLVNKNDPSMVHLFDNKFFCPVCLKIQNNDHIHSAYDKKSQLTVTFNSKQYTYSDGEIEITSNEPKTKFEKYVSKEKTYNEDFENKSFNNWDWAVAEWETIKNFINKPIHKTVIDSSPVAKLSKKNKLSKNNKKQVGFWGAIKNRPEELIPFGVAAGSAPFFFASTDFFVTLIGVAVAAAGITGGYFAGKQIRKEKNKHLEPKTIEIKELTTDNPTTLSVYQSDGTLKFSTDHLKEILKRIHSLVASSFSYVPPTGKNYLSETKKSLEDLLDKEEHLEDDFESYLLMETIIIQYIPDALSHYFALPENKIKESNIEDEESPLFMINDYFENINLMVVDIKDKIESKKINKFSNEVQFIKEKRAIINEQAQIVNESIQQFPLPYSLEGSVENRTIDEDDDGIVKIIEHR